MYKRIASILLSAMLVFTLVGCDSNNKSSKEDQGTKQTATEKQSKLDKFKQELKSKGHDVGENEVIAYEMLGANNGYKFKVDGELIEIYEYDKDKLSEEGKKYVEQAKNGSVSMQGMNFPVKYNDYLMLARIDEHSKANEIIEVFNSL